MELLNTTDTLQVTQACFDWCKGQIPPIVQNAVSYDMWPLAAALIFLFIAELHRTWHVRWMSLAATRMIDTDEFILFRRIMALMQSGYFMAFACIAAYILGHIWKW